MDKYQVFTPSCFYTHILAVIAVLVTPYLTYCLINVVESAARRAKYRHQWVRRTRS